MPWILLLLALTCAACIYLSKRIYMSDWPVWIAIGSGISFVVFAIIFAITYPSSVSSNAALLAFYENNYDAFQRTARITQEMTVGSDTTMTRIPGTMFDAPHMEQAKITSQRWAELRNQVVEYNRKLRSKREYYDNWFLRLWIAEPPENLPYIEFPKE